MNMDKYTMKNRKPQKKKPKLKNTDSLTSESQLNRAREEACAHFEKLVEDAINGLPRKLREAVRNLSIIVEDEPTANSHLELGHDPDEPVLGLYVGVPLPERAFGEEPYLPDQIFIFRKPLEQTCRNPKELQEQIRITVVHELAHYFGFDEEHLVELGLD